MGPLPYMALHGLKIGGDPKPLTGMILQVGMNILPRDIGAAMSGRQG